MSSAWPPISTPSIRDPSGAPLGIQYDEVSHSTTRGILKTQYFSPIVHHHRGMKNANALDEQHVLSEWKFPLLFNHVHHSFISNRFPIFPSERTLPIYPSFPSFYSIRKIFPTFCACFFSSLFFPFSHALLSNSNWLAIEFALLNYLPSCATKPFLSLLVFPSIYSPSVPYFFPILKLPQRSSASGTPIAANLLY